PLDLANLRVEQVQGMWCVRDTYRRLFVFGPHAEEAYQAAAVMRRHGFTQIGYVGQLVPSMMVFTAAPDAPQPPALRSPVNLASRTKLISHSVPADTPPAGTTPAGSEPSQPSPLNTAVPGHPAATGPGKASGSADPLM